MLNLDSEDWGEVFIGKFYIHNMFLHHTFCCFLDHKEFLLEVGTSIGSKGGFALATVVSRLRGDARCESVSLLAWIYCALSCAVCLSVYLFT